MAAAGLAVNGYTSPALEAFSATAAREKADLARRDELAKRPITAEEAAALTLEDWNTMPFERRNKLYRDQQQDYERLREASMGNGRRGPNGGQVA